MRTNVLPSEGGLKPSRVSRKYSSSQLLKYLKQQTLSLFPLLPAMQEIQGNMDDVLSRNDLRDDEKAKRYFQLQNRYLAFKEQLNTRTRPEKIISIFPDLTSRTQDSSTATTAFSTLLKPFSVTPELTQAAISQTKKPHPTTTLKSCFPDPSSHSGNPITTRPEAQKASDSICKLFG